MENSVKGLCKVYAATVAGLFLSYLLGYHNTITISVTAILVVLFGHAHPTERLRHYIRRRIAVQILCCAISGGLLFLLKRCLPMDSSLMLLFTAMVTMPVVLALDHQFRISPTFLMTSSVSNLVIILGTVEADAYVLKRLFLVAAGCGVGYLVDFLFKLGGVLESEHEH